MNFVDLSDNIDTKIIHVIDNVDSKLWWIKLCVYEIVDTSEIGHMCKMNYMDDIDKIPKKN
jgi:hypothetical protein